MPEVITAHRLPSVCELWIDGQFNPGRRDDTMPTENPATGGRIADVSAATREDVDDAVTSAKRAFEQVWSRLEYSERAGILRDFAESLIEHQENLAALESIDTGKPIGDCRAEVVEAASWFNYFADAGRQLRSSVIPTMSGQFTFTLNQPVGVVGVITPWNYPLAIYGVKLAAALAMGNCVVLKPAEQSPLTALAIAQIASRVGLPPGVLNVVPGTGVVAGSALVEHPDVAMISFTGSTTVGKAIGAKTGGSLKKATLELGGKSPNIVFADADLEAAAATALFSFTVNQGQLCSAGTRLLVEESIRGEFLERLLDRASRLVVGDPLAPATQLGALISDKQLQRIESYVEVARREGGDTLCGGERRVVEGHESGYFFSPTIIEGLPVAGRAAQEEIFGPVLTVLPFNDEGEAVRLANSVEYGLAAGVWTQNMGRMHRVAAAVEAGIVWVNTMHAISPNTPFSGWKSSGSGFEGGVEQATSFTKQKTVWVNHSASAPSF